MKRSEYEAAVRASGLDGICKAMLMQAASFKHWTDDVDPFVSIQILTDATGFSRATVAPRYRLLQENGWLVPTGKKTNRGVSYYRLSIGSDFTMPARSKASARETTDSEADLPGLTQGVCETDRQVSTTQTGGCLPGRQEGVCEVDTDSVYKIEGKNEPKNEVPVPGRVTENVSQPSLVTLSSSDFLLVDLVETSDLGSEEDGLDDLGDIEWVIAEVEPPKRARQETLRASENTNPSKDSDEAPEDGTEQPGAALDPSRVRRQAGIDARRANLLRVQDFVDLAVTKSAGWSGSLEDLIAESMRDFNGDDEEW